MNIPEEAREVMDKTEERLEGQPILMSTPGKKCSHISGDHPPICTESPKTACLKCPEYLDGICDLIPWDKEKITENQKKLLDLYERRRKLYARLDPIYNKIHKLADLINMILGKVRKEQGR